MYLVEETNNSDVYEDCYWQASVVFSNRFGNSVQFTSCASDRIFNIPKKRTESTIKMLKGGMSPDEIAQGFPIEFQ